ncbi:MAG: hypothetical protein HY000_28175, partial [Planctomycetes bacterium]|nr:hypothetical protein [Planctomycetota bacterium]
MSLASWSQWWKSGRSLAAEKFAPRREARPPRDRRKLHVDALEQRQLLAVTPIGTDFQVNNAANAAFDQRFGIPFGDSTRSVAVDHDGDFAVAWTSYYDQDGDGAGVFVRLFNRFGLPITDEIQVNQFTEGDQENAAVAMDGDGDFIVTWESQGQDPYDASAGIYARRFSAVGAPLGPEFRVHTNQVDSQVNPAVAMNHLGQFVISWQNESQLGSFFNDVRAQLFSEDGTPVGGEFRVNQVNVPSGIEFNSDVAMTLDGSFVITWNGGNTIAYRVYNADGSARINEMRADVSDASFVPQPSPSNNATFGHNPRLAKPANFPILNAQVAMDHLGNFTIVWQSAQDNDLVTQNDQPDSYGIYFRRFTADGNPSTHATRDSAVNFVRTEDPQNAMDTDNFNGFKWNGNQVSPSIALDADGDFGIVWDGNGTTYGAGPYGYENDPAGVWTKRYVANAELTVPNFFGASTPGDTSFQERANANLNGAQQNASIAYEPDGDFIIVWDGYGVGDNQGIFAQRYNESADAAGPLVTEALINGGRVKNGDTIAQSTVNSVVVRFDEQLNNISKTGTFSVENPNNWRLLRNGVEVTGGISNVEFDFNAATNKWEAVVSLDGNGSAQPGSPALTDGPYQIIALNSIRDAAGNPLGSNGFVPNGGNFVRSFNVQLPA